MAKPKTTRKGQRTRHGMKGSFTLGLDKSTADAILGSIYVPPCAVKVFEPHDTGKEGAFGEEVYQRHAATQYELGEVLTSMGAMFRGRTGGKISGTVFVLIRKER